MSQNARQWLSRSELTREKILGRSSEVLLGALIEDRPDARSERPEKLWDGIQKARDLWLGGREDLAKSGAAALQAMASEQTGLTALRAHTLCEELLRDAGDQNFRVVEAKAESVVELWAAQREYRQLAGALLTSANLYRSQITSAPDENYRRALALVQGAYYVVTGLARRSDPDLVDILRHQALMWRLRLAVVHARERETDQIRSDLDEMKRLALKINRPRVSFETLQEEVGYLNQWGDLDTAEKRLAEAKVLVKDLARPLTRIRYLVGEIELHLAAGRTYQAAESIQEYIEVWKTHPDAYHLRHLERWKKRRVPPEVIEPAYFVPPRPVFIGAGLPGLYLEKRLGDL